MLRLEKVNGANGYAFPFGIYDDDMPVGFVETGDMDGEEAIAVWKL